MENNITIKRNLPRDVFMHLLAIVTLYWSAVTFVTLLWQYINYYFPDNLNNYYYMGLSSPIRFAVASLIILFPVFILVSWYLNKIYKREAAVRDSKIRKWLIYFTLFITSLFIIGDLIFIINAFLGGEPTTKFILKSLSVLLVSGFVFGYYLDDVRRDTPAKSAKYFAWFSIILVLIVIIGAFFIVGSPMTARLIQYDQQKESDLQGIQSQIVNYWQRKGFLPNSLSNLNDPISSFMVPVDPQSKVSYEYIIKDASNLSFELCATFNKATDNTYNGPSYQTKLLAPMVEGGIQQNWLHEAGRTCFERTIDKQLYPYLIK